MEKQIIVRGVLVGALGGLLAFVFGRIFGEPVIGRAIDYESGRDAAQAVLDKAAGLPVEDMGPEVFTRTLQSNIGIGFGMLLFGIAMGALFAVVYSVSVGRVGKVSPRNLALLIAGAMFSTMYLVPFLKYPANPPSIGHGETIKARTGLYLVMVVCSIAFLLGAVWLGRRLAARFGNWTATLLAAAAFAVAIGIVMLLLPSLGHLSANASYGDFASETPQPLRDSSGKIVYPGFSADDLYAFRLYSLAAQAILWTAIGLTFAPLAARLLGERAGSVQRAEVNS
ncbi:CbtA family protein [Antrihabitans cavernicola]|uniref:CbtA family protein n=1 Tax=Antrihabitans cavernicola TaxID=2495913 RepID=A0A5A7SCV1_9NOCA|nr:CbtA family protein [Spelaeibacter cavernicola]KAA0022031.1 CbtA family protein [Spelaeibacter cavernicola]